MIFKRAKRLSRFDAKSRLKSVIGSDRSLLSEDKSFEKFKKDIYAVISQYQDISQNAEITFNRPQKSVCILNAKIAFCTKEN